MQVQEFFFRNFISQQINMNIPLYQREYSWSKEECQELFDDIMEIGANNERQSYFIGSIVYKVDDTGVIGSISNLDIIDGQQRITTLTLLLCSFCKKYKEINNDQAQGIFNNNIVNNNFEKTKKLYLRDKDNVTLNKIISSIFSDKDLDFDDGDSINIQENYKYFNKLLSDVDMEIFWQGFNKLSFISVRLQREDRPQSIFESLNSTGKRLTNSDLIRNYVLMDSEDQQSLYNDYWKEIESIFSDVDENDFDVFFSSYLMSKLNAPITDIYKEFKHFANLKYGNDIKMLVKDIYNYAGYYDNLFYGNEKDKELKKVFDSLRSLNNTVIYRFLLSVYDDYLNQEINLSKEDFIQITQYIESYVLRRYMCNLNSNAMGSVFLQLHKKIDKDNYLDSFIVNLLKYPKSDSKRFPTDIEFKVSSKTRKIYKNKPFREHVLSKLENHGNKEIVTIENCTIEHIMPQNLTPEWKETLGEDYKEIHETYLHTIGNLTLTARNSEMGNKTFTEKKNIKEGFNDSKLHLNKYLSNISSWNENEIIKRADILFEDIKSIWKYPEITQEIADKLNEIREKETGTEYTINDYKHLEEHTHTRRLYDILSDMILDMDDKIVQIFNKKYIAFKITKNLTEIEPQKQGLKLFLDIEIDKLDDPKGFCKDLGEKGHYGTGDTMLYLKKEENINYVFKLIKQTYELSENNDIL